MTAQLRNYTRWYRTNQTSVIAADILGTQFHITVSPLTGVVTLQDRDLTPDEARLIGVRLIDAAVLADGDRAIRKAPNA